MKIHVHTDASLDADAAQSARFCALLEQVLARFRDHLQRVDAHLSDINGDKGGAAEQRCLIEAHIVGREPVAVSHNAPRMAQAVRGAADKLARLLDSTLERLHGYPRGAGLGAVLPQAPEVAND